MRNFKKVVQNNIINVCGVGMHGVLCLFESGVSVYVICVREWCAHT